MWKIIQIFDGEYGCEEHSENWKAKVCVTLENELGERKYIETEDEWLVEHHLEEGDCWPEI